jgi:hypothetical protein
MKNDNIITKIYMSKLGEVNEKVIINIGMELNKLATLVTDSSIINIFSPEGECDLLDWQELNTAIDKGMYLNLFIKYDIITI